MTDPPEVCSLSGRVMWPRGATPIRCITQRHSLSPTSFTRLSAGLPLRVTFHIPVERDGLTEFHAIAIVDGLDGPSPPVGCTFASSHGSRDRPPTVPFWPEPLSIFGSFSRNEGSTGLHICSSYRPSLAPTPDDASSGRRCLTASAPAFRPGVHCPKGSAPDRCQSRTPWWATGGETPGYVMSHLLSVTSRTKRKFTVAACPKPFTGESVGRWLNAEDVGRDLSRTLTAA